MMKKGLILLSALPLLMGCAGGIGATKMDGGTNKTTYTLKANDEVRVYFYDEKHMDIYTSEKYHNTNINSTIGDDYWTYGPFSVQVVFWEAGLDVSIKEENKPEINFAYRGNITITVYCSE